MTGFIVPASQRAHDPARKCADVGAAVTADLGLVAHAAQRHAHELASKRAGNRLADRCLADAGRADEGEDRTRASVVSDVTVGAQLPHRQVLDDPFLDVLETGVVGVEHLARIHRVELVLGALRPRHRQQPVEVVGVDHSRLGRGLADLLEAPELTFRLRTEQLRACHRLRC